MTQTQSIATAAGSAPPAVLPLRVLQNRSQFLRAARARKAVKPGFILQIRDRRDADDTIGMGFTCSKKVGNAVARNRAKRRLREIARLTLPIHGTPGHDYVLIGRAGATASTPFDDLLHDLIDALGR